MAGHDLGLLEVSWKLLGRSSRRGKLAAPLVRRSVSTTYYAVFHFLADEAAKRLIGSGNGVRCRRRTLIRSLTHSDLRTALVKVAGTTVDRSVEDLLRPGNRSDGSVSVPAFVRTMAATFLEAQTKREDADYDLNKSITEADARLLLSRATSAMEAWRAAFTREDRDFKHALSVLFLLKGQLRRDA